ncbi:MAG: sugar phosphate isomerase/epimerase family protein [Pseudomonadota bacterium]
MSLKERIGVDIGRRLRLEDGIAWAAANGVRCIDVEIDLAPNALESFTAERASGIRGALERHGVRLGLHTLSAVNIAETSPFVREAVDLYLKTYIDVAGRLGAGWIVVHAGYHFTADYDARLAASLERLARAAEYAEKAGAKLLLENLNREPDHAEVHYLAYDLRECRTYFDRIGSSHLGWSFTVNHAHLVPEGIGGFLDDLGLARLGEVRLADNLGDRELHLKPGEGNIDFRALFRRLESSGFRGHYMTAFGSLDDMLEGREELAAWAADA